MSYRRVLALIILLPMMLELSGCGIIRIRKKRSGPTKQEKKTARAERRAKGRAKKALAIKYRNFRKWYKKGQANSLLEQLHGERRGHDDPSTILSCMKRRRSGGKRKPYVIRTKILTYTVPGPGRCNEALSDVRKVLKRCKEGLDDIAEEWASRKNTPDTLDVLCERAKTAEKIFDKRVIAVTEGYLNRYIKKITNLNDMIGFYSPHTRKAFLKKYAFPLMKWRKLKLSKSFIKGWDKRYRTEKAKHTKGAIANLPYIKKTFNRKLKIPNAFKAVRRSASKGFGTVKGVFLQSGKWYVKKRSSGMPVSRSVKGLVKVRNREYHPKLCVLVSWNYVEEFDAAHMRYQKSKGAYVQNYGLYTPCRG